MRPKRAFRPTLDDPLEGRRVPSGLAHPATAAVHHEIAPARSASGHPKLASRPIHPMARAGALAIRATGPAAPAPGRLRPDLSTSGFTNRPRVLPPLTRQTASTPVSGTVFNSSNFAQGVPNNPAGTFLGGSPNTLGFPFGTSANGNPVTFTSSSTPLNGGFNYTTAGTFIGANNAIGFSGGLFNQAGFPQPSISAGNVSGGVTGPVSSSTSLLPFNNSDSLPFNNSASLPFSPAVTPALGVPFSF